jgi:fatty acid synthase
VFVGAASNETEQVWCFHVLNENGYGLTGCARAMLANRISYWLGVTGKLPLTLSNEIAVEFRLSES